MNFLVTGLHGGTGRSLISRFILHHLLTRHENLGTVPEFPIALVEADTRFRDVHRITVNNAGQPKHPEIITFKDSLGRTIFHNLYNSPRSWSSMFTWTQENNATHTVINTTGSSLIDFLHFARLMLGDPDDPSPPIEPLISQALANTLCIVPIRDGRSALDDFSFWLKRYNFTNGQGIRLRMAFNRHLTHNDCSLYIGRWANFPFARALEQTGGPPILISRLPLEAKIEMEEKGLSFTQVQKGEMGISKSSRAAISEWIAEHQAEFEYHLTGMKIT